MLPLIDNPLSSVKEEPDIIPAELIEPFPFKVTLSPDIAPEPDIVVAPLRPLLCILIACVCKAYKVDVVDPDITPAALIDA